MTVDTMYKLVLFCINKNQSGYVAPADFNIIINQGQLLYLEFLIGPPEQYQPGRPIPKVSLSLTEEVREILTAFIDPLSTLTIDSTGLATYPTGFQRVDAMLTTDLINRIKFTHQDSLWSTLKSTIDPVLLNPIYLIESGGFRFYPNDVFNGIGNGITGAKISFIKTPPQIVWSAVPASDPPIYDPGNSVDPVWYDLDCYQVIARALRIVGVNLQAAVISQYAEEIKNTGE
jgi:hypothetical protein